MFIETQYYFIRFIRIKRSKKEFNFQLTVVTLTLEIGQNVQLSVEKVLKPERELVLIQPQLMEVQIVLGKRLRHDPVTKMTVQV